MQPEGGSVMGEKGTQPIEAALKTYVGELTGFPDLTVDQPLLATGIIDSMDFVHILLFIERQFHVRIKPFDIYIEDFQTIAGMAKVVVNQLSKSCH